MKGMCMCHDKCFVLILALTFVDCKSFSHFILLRDILHIVLIFCYSSNRKVTLPIIICSTAILPGQSMEIRSSDPKLQMLVDYILKSDEGSSFNEIGIMGLNPHDHSSPLTVGVTASVTKSNVKQIPSILPGVHSSDTMVQITGKKSFEIEEEPFLHESNSFYMAHVEIIDDREEIMSQEQVQNAEQLSKKLPSLIKKWKDLVNSQSQSVRKQVQNVTKSIGPLPSEVEKDSIRRRALWVGSLVNPSSTLVQGKQLCPEIRPALLACKNNYQRIYLAVLSLQSSIDHLSKGETSL